MSVWLTVSDVFGFFGSLGLAWPAIRLSAYLRTIRLVERSPGGMGDPGERLVGVMRGHSTSWNLTDHVLLISGAVLLVGSFALRMAANAGWL